MIAIGTYVDHQEAVQYPVSHLAETWKDFDKLFWFGSDQYNCDILRTLACNHPCKNKLSIVNINKKIERSNAPGCFGITAAQNACVKYMLDNTSAEFIAYQQADLCLTESGARAIIDLTAKIIPDGKLMQRMFIIAAMQSKLYCETECNPLGCVVFHRNCSITYGDDWLFNCSADGENGSNEFGPDGWYIVVNGAKTKPIGLEQRYMLDLGYLDTGAYYRKLVNHAKIWPDYQWKNQIKAQFDKNKINGIIMALRRIKSYDMHGQPISMVDYSGEYKILIDKFKLLDDYNLVKLAFSRANVNAHTGVV